ncbi:MAG: hypothetical protein AB2693_27180 [Candidatus Thiodiazotropha sp.]
MYIDIDTGILQTITVNRMSSSLPNGWSFSYIATKHKTSIFINFLHFELQNKTKGGLGSNTGDQTARDKRTQNHVTSRNRSRSTALERSAIDYWGA